MLSKCALGIELVVLDLQNSSEKKYLKTAKQARELTAHYQTRLIINTHLTITKDLKVDGVHLDPTIQVLKAPFRRPFKLSSNFACSKAIEVLN